MDNDLSENNNLSEKHPDLVAKYTKSCIGWHRSMPSDNGPNLAGDFRRKKTTKGKNPRK